MKYLNFSNLNYFDYLNLIKFSFQLKKKKINLNKKAVMFFELPSTRTDISFSLSCKKLGINLYKINKKYTQFKRGEKIKDIIRILNEYFDLIISRTNSKKMNLYNKYFKGSFINALNEKEHPTQILNDIYTMFEIKKNFKFTVTWVGELNNVFNSLYEAHKIFNFKLKVYTKDYSKKYKKIKIEKSLKKSCKNTNFIITDTINSMCKKKKKKKNKEFMIKKKHLRYSKNSYFMHCMPIYRNIEVDKRVIDMKNSIIWKQAKNKLYTTSSLIYYILK